MQIKKKIVPTLTNLSLRNINDIIIDIYRELNKVSKSAEEITFRTNEKGQRELIINDKGKEYRDVAGAVLFDTNNIASLKKKAKTKIKENLEIDNVTNESKSTMFTNPTFTGDSAWNNETTNIAKFFGAGNNNVYLQLHNLAHECAISLYTGLTQRWNLGLDNDDAASKFKIHYNTDNEAGSRLADPSNFELDSSGNLVISGLYSPFLDIKIHQWYATDSNQDYIPFGGSQVESNSTADSLNDDTLFIAPYAGTLESIKLQCATGVGGTAGSTDIALRVNGTTKTAVNATIGNEVTQTFTWSGNNTFAAGDRIRISFNPSGAPKQVTATSVWKYTT